MEDRSLLDTTTSFNTIRKAIIDWVVRNTEEIELAGITIEEIANSDERYIVYFLNEEYVGQIIVEKPTFAPYRFVCFEVVGIVGESADQVYEWYDDDSSGIPEILIELAKGIEFMLNY